MSGKTEKAEPERLTIDERIKELEDQGATKETITQTLYEEKYSTQEIMKRHLPLKSLKKKPTSDAAAINAMGGTVKGTGYLQEFKDMIQQQISRNRELTDVFYNIGLGSLLAALNKAGLSMEDFRKIALKKEGLREALESAGKTIFKALEYYESDLITKVEDERDGARAYATILETKVKELVESLDPKIRLEKMVQAYLFSGNVEPDVLMALIDKWLAMEVAELKVEMIAT